MTILTFHIDMKNFALSITMLCVFSSVFSQKDYSIKYANTITSDELKEHLSILASDALEGRETGERGQKMAAAYIEHYFESNGLEPIVNTPSGNSYLQSFDLVRIHPGKTWMKTEDNTYENRLDFVYTGKANFTEPAKTKLVFVGEGNEADYKAIKAQGNSVIIFSEGDRVSRNKKTELAYEHGARNVFIMQSGTLDNFKRTVNMYKRYTSSGRLSLPPETDDVDRGYFHISLSMGTEILKSNEKTILNSIEKAKTGKYGSLLKIKSEEVIFFASQQIEEVTTENVLGFIEGTDKKDEYIILTAHYDHIGVRGEEINNGADDDGSGTVAVMEIAQAFSIAKKAGHGPRRSILFMTVTGEEKGLLGSSYYVTHPTLPLENTITNLNIDMIGRVDSKHEETPNYIYLIGSDKLSKELHELSEDTNLTYSQLEFDYSYNSDDDPNRFYYRSDHYNFVKNNIPVIFYFNGTHPDYHRPTDTVDKIAFDVLTNRTKLIFHTTWEIANRDARITVDVNPEERKIENAN